MSGRLVGSYRLLRKLGEGGMGAVYEAVHQQLGRHVAVKMLGPEFAREPEIIERFFNEARAVNIIQHPDIVNISELGHLADGAAYLVMEYLPGESLSQRLAAKGRCPLPEALRVARQVAAALRAAHDKGIVHRDLKPDNVMLIADVERGERAKVLDFGIAKLAEEHEVLQPRQARTRAGMVLGTPVYMAPEQCRGASEVDGRADVYSLGVMLYQMLLGRPPFVAEGEGELVAMHIYEVPTPLSELMPTLPRAVSDLVQEMLEKDREQRPTMAGVVERLDRLGAPRTSGIFPILAAAPFPPEPPAEIIYNPPPVPGSPRGRKLLYGAAVVLLGATLLGLTSLRRTTAGAQVARPAARPPVHPSGPPAPGVVRWSVITEPPGAEIVRLSDGAVLAVTPFVQERPAGSGALPVLLRRPGFADKRLELDLSANVMVRESLWREPSDPPVAAARPHHPAKAARTRTVAVEPPPPAAERRVVTPVVEQKPPPAAEGRVRPGPGGVQDFEKVLDSRNGPEAK